MWFLAPVCSDHYFNRYLSDRLCLGEGYALSRDRVPRRGARAGCSFHAAVQADLGETAVQFAMDCDAGPDGAVALTVTEPETLSGITARAAAESGQLTFDGLALDFGLLANGNVVPAAAPAIVVDCWLRQYISSAGQEEERYRVTYERDFDEKNSSWTRGLKTRYQFARKCAIMVSVF